MKTPIIYSLLSCFLAATFNSTTSAASTYNIDFNVVGGAGGAGWNTYNEHTDLLSSTKLSDTDSNASSVFITATGDIITSAGNNLYNSSTAPSWVSSGAGNDFFWTDNDPDNNPLSFTMTFGGLTAGNTVSLDLFASRNSSLVLEANYEYSLDGSTWFGFNVLENDGSTATTDGWNTNNTQSQLFNLDEDGGYANGRYLNISGVNLTNSTLDVRVSVPGAANYAGINAMRLTVIPEANSYALLAGLLGMSYVMLRRRQG